MNEAATLGFSCPQCGTGLTVPLDAAGSEGPCPACGESIRAPRVEVREGPVKVEEIVRMKGTERPRGTGVTTFKRARDVRRHDTRALIGEQLRARRLMWIALLGIALALAAGGIGYFRDGSRKTPEMMVAGAGQTFITENPEVISPEKPVRRSAPPDRADVDALIEQTRQVLIAFIEATTLEGRESLIESEATREELAGSVLAGALPGYSGVTHQSARIDRAAVLSDMSFRVKFVSEAGAATEELLVVRCRGTQPPKVLSDPFLDGYGGRFRGFASSQRDGERTFRLIMTAFDFSTDESVPEPANKLTVKLRESLRGPDVGNAYFSKFSPLRQKLEKLGVKYGRTSPVTLMLKWNKESTPFIEVIDVRAAYWE